MRDGSLNNGKMPAAPLLSVRLVVFGIVVLTVGNFSQGLTGLDESSGIQQVAALVLWLCIIAISFLPGTMSRIPTVDGLLWPALFFCYAVLSPLWSSTPQAGLGKSAVLFVTTFGAWRLSGMMRVSEFFQTATQGLLLLASLSVFLVFLVPSVGVLATWQHSGQWAGVFVSKQLLGTAAAFLVLLSLLRLFERKRPLDVISLGLGVACVVGSGSRGGAILAIAAVVCIWMARRSSQVAVLVSFLPLIVTSIASGVILFLAYTGYEYLPLFGARINLTERTLIWQYGIGHWIERLLLGFGLNGFWSDQDLYYSFLRKHEWVLDNFHSGYNTIAIELGLLGTALFFIVTTKLCWEVARLVSRPTERDPFKNKKEAEFVLGFIILFFTINMTETFLLRSTSFFQTAFTFLLASVFARHGGTSQNHRGLRTSQSQRPLNLIAPGGAPARGRVVNQTLRRSVRRLRGGSEEPCSLLPPTRAAVKTI
jgi:exopolysaccharide production protein ExoQ